MIVVIEYSSGDGCTYCCTETFTMDADSVDDAKLRLMIACEEAIKNGKQDLIFTDSYGDDRTVEIAEVYCDGNFFAPIYFLANWAFEALRSLKEPQ
jgi:hypothetical protein